MGQSTVITGTNQFGYQLFSKLPGGSNVLISPLSISIALRMALNGASGETYDQISKALGASGINLATLNGSADAAQKLLISDPAVEFSIANSIWTRKGFTFEKPFLNSVTQTYQAKLSDLDFNDPRSAQVINDWVKSSTHNKIDSIVPSRLPSDVVMYLINAIYFKGKWASAFQASDTEPAPFTLADGSKIEIPMMHQTVGGAFHLTEGREGIAFPYKGGSFEMVAILPAESERPSDLVTALATKDLLSTKNPVSSSVRLSFPKFKFSFEAVLNQPLKSLGITAAFSDHADFSGMRSKRDVAISEVRHKTYIDVTEEGTEAAAVTSIGVRAMSAVMNPPKELKFDRPFVFMIRHHDSGQIVFLGVVQNPKS